MVALQHSATDVATDVATANAIGCCIYLFTYLFMLVVPEAYICLCSKPLFDFGPCFKHHQATSTCNYLRKNLQALGDANNVSSVHNTNHFCIKLVQTADTITLSN